MKQYCRYCCYLITGNGIYCIKRENTLSESDAKAANKCRDFSYNPQDAFMENEKDISQDSPKRSSVTDRLRCGGRMTEQEAIKILTLNKKEQEKLPNLKEVYAVAIAALEEIQNYRELEKRLKDIYGDHNDLVRFAVEGLETYRLVKSKAIILTDDDVDRWNAYKSIGPVEECREAVEKQQAKKPNIEADGYADDYMVYDTWICPCCGISYKVDYDDYKYCPDCGQHIDWGE